MKHKELIDLLRLQAKEIADEGHNGWGNTMLMAARKLENQPSTNQQARINENLYWIEWLREVEIACPCTEDYRKRIDEIEHGKA